VTAIARGAPYGARSQHSDLLLQPELGDTRAIGWFRLLRERGERCLTTPG